MFKRLALATFLILAGFIVSTLEHFINGNLPDFIVFLSILMVSLGCIQMFISGKAIEREKAQLEHLSSFFSGDQQQAKLSYFAHEVRTPLHGIMGMLDLIENETDPQQINKLVDTARKASDNLLLVLNNNIDAARIQQEDMIMTREAAKIADIGEHVVRLHAGNAQYKGLDFNFHLDPQLLDIELELDRSRLQQVLNNLLGNAIKFTQQGSIKLWASIVERKQYMVCVRFAVEDTGLGISDEDQVRLMSPFQQVGEDRLKQQGSGIGLYVSNEILHRMHSELQIKSKHGQGSLFFFNIELPIIRETKPLVARPGSSITVLANRGSTYELIAQYLDYWKFNHNRLLEWDDLLLNRSNQTIILDEAMAKDNISQLKQLLFGNRGRIIIIKELSSIKDNLITYDWREFRTITKPIMPNELIAHILKNDLDTTLNDEDASQNIYHQLHAFNNENPGFRILCVDDNHVNQLVLKKQLQTLGFNFVQLADNGQHALHMVKDSDFDAIFMDFNMPILDGISATKILRKRGYNRPIIGITAQDMDEDDNPADIQMDAVLRKPINGDKLAEFCLSMFVKSEPASRLTRLSTNVADALTNTTHFLLYVSGHQALNDQSFIDDTLQMLGIDKKDTKVLASDLIRREDIKGVKKVIVDVSKNQYAQMRIARRLRKLGFDHTILALSPIESDILNNTFEHFGFDKGGTANTLLNVLKH
ncbi:MAG TPA: ATP-binding protein [Pseudomonadales bacterium]|nr:ATP-binding protein [Pseudomonadales bacterium]